MASAIQASRQDKANWRAQELHADLSTIVRPLDAAELAAIDSLLPRLFDPDRNTGDATASQQAPKLLRTLFAEVRRELLDGRGIVILRGLPVDRWSARQAAAVLWLMSDLLGYGVSQNTSEFVSGVYDRQAEGKKRHGSQNRSSLKFHCDLADIVGLLCCRKARSGGMSRAASMPAIYDEIRKSHPEYLEPLHRGFHWSRNDDQQAHELAYSPDRIPVFTDVGGAVSSRYNYPLIAHGSELAAEPLTALQQQALECINEIANRPEVSFDVMLEHGDVQFLNNYTVLHSRTEFEDWDDPDRRRLLLRLWARIDGVRDMGPATRIMRDAPLIYGEQGRTPTALAEYRAAAASL